MNPIEEKLRILKPILQPKQWDYLRMSYAMEKDFKKRFQIENMIDLLIAKNVPGLQMDQILLPPPDAGQLSGEYPIGRTSYPGNRNSIFGVREKEWIKHCGIFGKTGSGKTTLMVEILKELCEKDKPFLDLRLQAQLSGPPEAS